MIPVLKKSQKLPTKRPSGPPLEVLPWTRATAALETLESILDEVEDPTQQQAALDKTCEIFAEDMEVAISRATNTVIKHPGHRCAPPTLVWLSAKAVESQHRVEWKSYWRS
eukprot:3642599-Pyramimonas_sp.AAC.1